MTISAQDIRELTGAGATIVNVGNRAGSREIRGAIRYRPSDLLEAEHLALPIAHDRPVVLYAEGGADAQTEQIATKMRAEGFTDVRVLAGTFHEYEHAGGETQEASLEQTVPPHRASEVNDLDRRV